MTSTVAAEPAVVGRDYPLEGIPATMEVDDAAVVLGDVRVCTLLAADQDWEWAAGRPAVVVAAIDEFADAVAQQGTGPLDWVSQHFGPPGAGFTLATRGGLQYGVVTAAVLETDTLAADLRAHKQTVTVTKDGMAIDIADGV